MSQRSGLVETANINLSCERDSKWLCAKNLFLNQLDDTVVDSHRKLHREFWRDYVSDNNNASQYYFIAGPVYIFETLS